MFSALGVTDDAVTAGELVLDLPAGAGSLRLLIVSDPATIPAETGRVEPSLLVVLEECAGKSGTWTAPVFAAEPKRRVYSVSEPETTSQRFRAAEHKESQYLTGIDGATKGTIIHEVLRGRDARVVCAEYGVYSNEVVRQCEEIVARFRTSALMQRVKREFCELPFVVTLSGVRITVSIDRLCELFDGTWVVIDYKSDPVTPSEYSLKAEEYALSLSVYCEAGPADCWEGGYRAAVFYGDGGVLEGGSGYPPPY